MDQSNFKGYPSPPSALTRPKQEKPNIPGPSNRKAGGKASSKNNDGTGSVPEFIQKLFRMLENKAFKNTFCWGSDGTTFIVKDTNEFSKTILPKHFKHCNFASFVRQLNKYDFHKVRNADDGHKPYGDQAWEFVHPRFMRDRKDLLEEIRRKTPGKAKKEDAPQPTMTNWNEESMNVSTSSNTTNDANVNRRQLHSTMMDPTNSAYIEEMKNVTQHLQLQIKELQHSRAEMEKHLQQLNNTDSLILQELMDLGKQMQTKDNLIQSFLKNYTTRENDTSIEESSTHVLDIQTLLDSYVAVSRSNSDQLDRITHQLQSQWQMVSKSEDQTMDSPNQSIPTNNNTQPSFTSTTSTPPPCTSSTTSTLNSNDSNGNNMTTSVPLIIPSQQPHLNVTASAAAAAASMNAGSLIGSPLKTGDGLTFVTLGRLSSNTTVRDNKPAFEITPSEPSSSSSSSFQQDTNRNGIQPPHQALHSLTQQQNNYEILNSASIATPTSTASTTPSSTSTRPTNMSVADDMQTTNAALSLKRKMNIAGWTVPPRVLLVDDDSVYRDLSGKLLQVIGCSIDLAKDGVEALRKMGLEKYDLILMDIVMPNLDGISATRNIRQYDALTPIISMTSNFTDNDIMQYIGSGMTDILPKPFSKKTLYSMLEKYCAHLKAIQRVHRVQGIEQTIPRPLGMLGLPPPPAQAQAKQSPPTSSSSTSTPTANTPSSSTLHPISQHAKVDDGDIASQTQHTVNSTSAVSTTSTPAPHVFSIAQSSHYPFPLALNTLANGGLPQPQPQQPQYSTQLTDNTAGFYNTDTAK